MQAWDDCYVLQAVYLYATNVDQLFQYIGLYIFWVFVVSTFHFDFVNRDTLPCNITVIATPHHTSTVQPPPNFVKIFIPMV
eukprot:6383491-Amphidinium_carterae.1